MEFGERMPRAKSKADDSLISFDSDSPLFAKKKPKAKKRGPKSKAEIEEAEIIAENKRLANKRQKKQKTKNLLTKKELPNVKSPSDCKHILPAFKKFLNKQWKILDGGCSYADAQAVASYIRAAANMCREKRPEEHEELMVLAGVARKIASECS